MPRQARGVIAGQYRRAENLAITPTMSRHALRMVCTDSGR